MAGIYIHIPFCKTRCIYCDFFTQTDDSPKDRYVDALCKELELRQNYLNEKQIETIYFGGGTPSQLDQNSFDRIFQAINTFYLVSPDAEITLECNPDDLDAAYLNMLASQPFNRISIGIQTFDDKELKFLKRRHTSEKAKQAVNQCKSLGYNISIDLMYGLPNQTLDTWIHNLDEAVNLDIQHISAYHLIYEEDTLLYKLKESGKVKSIEEELSVEMFSAMIDKLTDNNFIHYEISNFAKGGYFSMHNSSYWRGVKYLGIGASAHSFDGENRAWNVSSMKKYIDGITNTDLNIEIEFLDKDTSYNDFILTGMRTMWGVDLCKLKNLFGTKKLNYCLKNIEKYIAQGFVVKENNILRLTKDGIFISDGIMSDLMWVK